jgi:hypothetical protein
MSDLATATRGLMTGGPVAEAALKSVLWAIGIVVVFAPPRGARVPAQDLTGPVRRPGGGPGKPAPGEAGKRGLPGALACPRLGPP